MLLARLFVSLPWPAAAASQTTYAAHQRPTVLRIIDPAHPLLGQGHNGVGQSIFGEAIGSGRKYGSQEKVR